MFRPPCPLFVAVDEHERCATWACRHFSSRLLPVFRPPWDLRVLEMELLMHAFVQVDWLTEKMRTTNFTVSVLHDEVAEFLGGAS